MRTIAAHRLQLVGSDGIFGEHPHPRLYGTAPRFLGRFAIREGLLPVEEAVARLTARAADRLGLADRGRIEPASAPTSSCSTRSATSTRRPTTTRSGAPTACSACGSRASASSATAATTGARPGGVVR